jgi:hypothetical protein
MSLQSNTVEPPPPSDGSAPIQILAHKLMSEVVETYVQFDSVFDPKRVSNLIPLIDSIISSPVMEDSLKMLEMSDETSDLLGLTSEDRTTALIELNHRCDEDRVYAFTWMDEQRKVRIGLSVNLWTYYERTADPSIGFLICVTIAHEYVHFLIRQHGVCSTPEVVKNKLSIDDAGCMLERELFPNLPLQGLPLSCWATSEHPEDIWFPSDSNTIWQNVRLGAYRDKDKVWSLVKEEFIEQSLRSGVYDVSKVKIEYSRHAPGNVYVHRSSSSNLDVSPAYDIVHSEPGNVMISGACGNMTKKPWQKDESQ